MVNKRVLGKLLVLLLFFSLIMPKGRVFSQTTDNLEKDEGILRTVYCSTVAEIQNALKDAKAGDRIVIKEGSYTGPWMTGGYFYSNASGTEEHPIIIEGESEDNKSELVGLRNSGGAVIYIVGSYWRINNLKVTNGQKGIIIDKGSNNIINNCEIYSIGQEGVHFRDGSCNNLLVNSKITETGLQNASFGEGVYVGSDKGKWETFVKECDNNIIRGCTIGPNVRAESVDVKEGTTGTIIEDCIFDGTGISGQNYADSFLDIKGNGAIIRNNIGYRNGNSIIVDAFQIHVQVEGWGEDNYFYGNTLYLDNEECYILNNVRGTATVYNNIRSPKGNMYGGTGENTIKEETIYEKEDFNRDGKIDLLDLSLISSHYNEKSTSATYEEYMDLNKDGTINIIDIVMVAKKIL